MPIPGVTPQKDYGAYVLDIADDVFTSNELILATIHKMNTKGSVRGGGGTISKRSSSYNSVSGGSFRAQAILKRSASADSYFRESVRYDASSVEQKMYDRICVAAAHYIKGDPKLGLPEKRASLISQLHGIDFRMPVDIITIPAGTTMTQMQAAGKGQGETRQGNYYSFYEPDAASMRLDADMRGIAESTLFAGPKLEGKMNDPGTPKAPPPEKRQTKASSKKNRKLSEGGANRNATSIMSHVAAEHKDDYYLLEKQLTLFKSSREISVLQSTAAPTKDTWSLPVSLDVGGGGKQLHVGFKDNSTVVPVLRFEWEKVITVLSKLDRNLTDKERAYAEDKLHTYAMVLYNRASFNKDMICAAVDELIFMEDKLDSNQIEQSLCQDAVDTTRAGILLTLEKHFNLGSDSAGEAKAEEALTQLMQKRRTELRQKEQELATSTKTEGAEAQPQAEVSNEPEEEKGRVRMKHR